jgi:hypothetical protein
MGSLVWKPAVDAQLEIARVVQGGARFYQFYPGVAQNVIPEDFSGVQTALRAIHGNMATPSAPTVAPQGTGGVETWGYKIAAVGQTGNTLLSAQGSTAVGNATLTVTDFNRVTRPALPAHATGWRVIRSASGGTPAGTTVDISGVLPASQATFDDTGIAGSAYSAAGSNPPVDLVAAGPAEM